MEKLKKRLFEKIRALAEASPAGMARLDRSNLLHEMRSEGLTADSDRLTACLLSLRGEGLVRMLGQGMSGPDTVLQVPGIYSPAERDLLRLIEEKPGARIDYAGTAEKLGVSMDDIPEMLVHLQLEGKISVGGYQIGVATGVESIRDSSMCPS